MLKPPKRRKHKPDWKLSVRAGNIFNLGLSPDAPHKAMGPGAASTRMNPPPTLFEVERALAQKLGAIADVTFQPSAQGPTMTLVLQDGSNVVHTPRDTSVQPVAATELNWR